MQNLVIVGNKSSAGIMYEYLRYDRRYRVEAFSVDAQYINEPTLFDLPVVALESLEERYPPSACKILIAVGYSDLNRVREGLFQRVKEAGYEVLTYIHPEAKVFSRAIGEGAIIMPNAYIDVYSEIGPNTIVWGNCAVAHHAKIGSNCWLATGSVISGAATLGDNTFVGISATVVNDVSVGKYNIIGASAMIAKSTEDYEVYINRQTEKFRLPAEDYLRFAKI